MCTKLQDRFTVSDVWQNDDQTMAQHIQLLRDNMPSEVDSSKYAASYFPNLETSLDYYYGPQGSGDANVSVNRNGTTSKLSELKTQPGGNALYYRARNAITAIPCHMPPSPAVVGIYARIDAARGVWKAPANADLAAVIEPSILLTDEQQDGLNIDAESGKSINAIRAFPGRGILIWGSADPRPATITSGAMCRCGVFSTWSRNRPRTLARRLSFELNSLNTWTRVRSMIENFLTKQWRAGALVGTTTEQAYYVRVGLNETMTEIDLLEGRMIVEIGMAVVRPAEFIILQFSHKLQSAA